MSIYERGDRVTFHNGNMNGVVDGIFSVKVQNTNAMENYYVLRTRDGQIFLSLIHERDIKPLRPEIPIAEIEKVLEVLRADSGKCYSHPMGCKCIEHTHLIELIIKRYED